MKFNYTLLPTVVMPFSAKLFIQNVLREKKRARERQSFSEGFSAVARSRL